MDTTTLKNAPAEVLNKDKNGVDQSLILQTDNEIRNEAKELTKNQVFANLVDYLCPVKFDDNALRNGLEALVSSGVMDAETVERTISANKTAFMNAHADELSEYEAMTWETFCDKVSENTELLKELKRVTKDSVLDTLDTYTDNKGNVIIWRSEQSTDRDGNNRYTEHAISVESEYLDYSATRIVFYEARPYSITNLILAIRYHSTFEDAFRSARREVKAAEANLFGMKNAVLKVCNDREWSCAKAVSVLLDMLDLSLEDLRLEDLK